MQTRRKIEVGDYITFRAATRCGPPKARRKVNGFDHLGRPTVRFQGWDRFVVGCFPGDRILKVERA